MKFASSIPFSALTLVVALKMVTAGGANRLRGPDLMNFLDAGARQLQVVDECGCDPSSDDVKILAPRKTEDPIALDGFYNDWDLANDYIADMSEAGKPTSADSYVVPGKAYARYRASDNLLCILVLSKDETFTFLNQIENMFLKIESFGNSVTDTATGTKIEYIAPQGMNGGLSGWEGCFMIGPGCHLGVEIHQNYLLPNQTGDGNTASTGKNFQGQAGKFSLCLKGTPCANDKDCATACTAGSCTEGFCSEMTATGGDTCCENVDDCDDKDCQKKSCSEDNKCSYVNDSGECGESGGTPECVNPATDCQDMGDCQTVTCVESICEYTNKNDTTLCDAEYQLVDECDLPKRCESGVCKNQYQLVDAACEREEAWWTDNLEGEQVKICHETTCKPTNDVTNPKKTTCQKSTKVDYSTVCAGGPEGVGGVATRGYPGCDLGDVCEAGECKTLEEYSYNQDPCRPSNGCCDIAEMCDANFECPVDEKHGSNIVCREACSALVCKGDRNDMCDGESNDCSADVILKEYLCIMAGQHYRAGMVGVESVIKGDSIEFQVEAQLEGDWTQSGSDAVKYFFSPTGQKPPSSPGQYSHVRALDDFGIYESQKETVQVCGLDGTTAMITFAMHLDVTHPVEGGQTAWALPCSEEEGVDPTGTVLKGARFMNKKGKYQGWGKYITYKPCCPTENCSGGCAIPAPTPTEPSNPPDSSYDCACSCGENGEDPTECTVTPPTRRARALFPIP